MLDETFVNGSHTPDPRFTFQYELCMDTHTKSWRRDEATGTLIFNGTALFTVSRAGRLPGRCSIEPWGGGNPLQVLL